jgi:hypothetical protein
MLERCRPRAVDGGQHTGVKEFAIIPYGGLFAVLSAGNIVLWDVQTRDLTGEVPIGVLPATGVRFTSDDRHLVYTDAEGLAIFKSPGRWRERE